MSLAEQLNEDLRAALRAGDAPRKQTLRLLIAALNNAAKEARGPLSPEAELAVLRRQAKQRQDAIAEFRRGGREDLVAVEEAELAMIQAYLPPPLDDAAIEDAARRVIADLGATGPQDMGRVMKALLADLGDRADGARASAAVRRLLAG
jgi:uncharacterized protein YqeY